MGTLLSIQDVTNDDHIHIAHTPTSIHEIIFVDGNIDDLDSEKNSFTPDIITQKEQVIDSYSQTELSTSRSDISQI